MHALQSHSLIRSHTVLQTLLISPFITQLNSKYIKMHISTQKGFKNEH